MPDQTPFESRLADAYARYVAAVPVAVDPQAMAAAVAEGSAGLRLGWRGMVTPGRRAALLVAVGLVALLLAAAALVGSRLTERPPGGGGLVYELNGDIYLANSDGTAPILVADGVPPVGEGGTTYSLGWAGPAWAPDGRHFLFFEQRGDPPAVAHIADADGRMVASIPGMGTDATWSPDSTRLEVWTGGSEPGMGTTQIGIHGIDGALQASLPLPAGYMRGHKHPGVWAPDGRSVYVILGQGLSTPSSGWQLSLDGSTPREIPDYSQVGDLMFSPDGSHVARSAPGPSLVVEKADGSDPLTLSGNTPRWSPTGTQLAYRSDGVTTSAMRTYDIRVLDVAAGTSRTIVTNLQSNAGPTLGWSAAGDRLLFTLDADGQRSLWSVNADGGDRRLLVAGTSFGEWQPIPTP